MWNGSIQSGRINTAASDRDRSAVYTLTLKPLNTCVSCQLIWINAGLFLPLQLLSLSLFAMNLHPQFCPRERNGWPRSNINEKVSSFHTLLMSFSLHEGKKCVQSMRVVAGRCRPMFLLQCLCWETKSFRLRQVYYPFIKESHEATSHVSTHTSSHLCPHFQCPFTTWTLCCHNFPFWHLTPPLPVSPRSDQQDGARCGACTLWHRGNCCQDTAEHRERVIAVWVSEQV